MRALVGLDLGCAACLLVGEWCHDAEVDGGRVAARARRVVDPLEEGALEPSQQGADDAVLVAPGGLLAGAQALCLGLQDLALLLGLVVDLLEGHDAQGLVEQSGVLPPRGQRGERVQHVAEAQRAGVARGLGHQGDVADGRVGGWRGGRGRLRRAKVTGRWRCGARVRSRGDLVESLCAEDGAEALCQFGGHGVRVHAGGRRSRGAV